MVPRNIGNPPQGYSERGKVLKAKIFKGKHTARLEFHKEIINFRIYRAPLKTAKVSGLPG